MMGLFVFIHSIACLILIAIVLMQSGRGGGLTEAFSSAESLFGAKTNDFMVKTTAILAGVFLVTSLSLAHFSSKAAVPLSEREIFQEETSLPDVTPPVIPEESAVNE